MSKYPNILIISIDSLRADHLSVYGYERQTTPYLCEFARDAVVFEKAYSASNWTGAAVTSLLTGLYPVTHGYNNNHYYLDDPEDSAASVLALHGYRTAAFSNNLYISDKTGLSAGFQDFFYRGKPIERKPPKPKRLPLLRKAVSPRLKHALLSLADRFRGKRALSRDDGAYETHHAFARWLRGLDGPFFAFIHYQETHSPYMPPHPYRRRFFKGSVVDELEALNFDHVGYYAGKVVFRESQVRRFIDLFDGAISYIDRRLHDLFALLRAEKRYDDTLIVVTADHGEMFGEHGFFWHAFCLYEPLIRVPLIVRYPPWFGRDRREERLVQTTDIVPTIFDGLKVDWKYRGAKQGLSFLERGTPVRQAALIEADNPERMVRRWLLRNHALSFEDFAPYCRSLSALVTARDKLIRASDGRHEFYDLEKDPHETRNLYSAGDGHIARRIAELREWYDGLPRRSAAVQQPDFDKETWEKMRALGYA